MGGSDSKGRAVEGVFEVGEALVKRDGDCMNPYAAV
jgi:hypothetical protein